jgi:non-specific serine/threonine protein kinase
MSESNPEDSGQTKLRPSPDATVVGRSDGPDGTQLRTQVHNTVLHETKTPTQRSDTATRDDAVTDLSTSYEDMTVFELAQPPVALSTGSVIKGRFLLEKQIGRGGMGLVFSAIDRRKQEARDPNPRIAIKILYGDSGTLESRTASVVVTGDLTSTQAPLPAEYEDLVHLYVAP